MRCVIFFIFFIACGSNDADKKTPSDADTATTTGVEPPTTPTPTTPTTTTSWDCVLDPTVEHDASAQIGCWEDFELLASAPLDASIPGASSTKTVVDRIDDNTLHFQNSQKYPIHWEFAFANLSGGGLPIVPDLSTFNLTEYYSPDRRFILGAVTWYEEPEVWAYEISPYDTADADMITTAYRSIRDNAYFGADLKFHPTSEAVEAVAEDLPPDVAVITTDELFEGITYQPLNLATSMGLLTFYEAEELETSHVNFREIVVLDAVPNDIAVTAGIITDQFQTPLAHINVLSQNRGTPNMALTGAFTDATLRDLDGKWVELTVGAFDWTIREVTQEEADAWWEENRPDPIAVNPMDLSVTGLVREEDILDLETLDLEEAIRVRIPALGGKATHYGGFAHMKTVPHPRAFVIPIYWYEKHLRENGLWDIVDIMLSEDKFHADSAYRDAQLAELRSLIMDAPIDPELVSLVETEILTGDYPFTRMRFRSSTNAEDVNDFNGAGLYDSESADPTDPEDGVGDAIKGVWLSVWSYRAFDERAYYSIPHTDIGMAVLVHRSFPDEDANGVAITANIFDVAGIEPGQYINVQEGEASVVQPDEGVTTDQLIYYYTSPGQPMVFLGHSNLVDEGETVLTPAETYELGTALETIHLFFQPVYGGVGFYGMDVEFKFDSQETGESLLYVKQARPYPGWGD